MIRNRIILVVLAGGLAFTGVTACGSSKPASKSVPASLASTSTQQGIQLTFTLKGSASSFPPPSGTMTASQEQALLNSSIVLVIHAADGTNLSNAGSGGEASLALIEGGNTLAQLEDVGSTLYGKVDISGIANAYGLTTGSAASAKAELNRLAPQVSGLSDLAAGKWVSIDLGALNTITQTAGVTLPSVPQMLARLVSGFLTALSQGTVSSSNGTNQVTVGAPQVLNALSQGVSQAFASTPYSTQINSALQKAQTHAANKTANVGVTTSGGQVSDINLSLNQFDTSHQFKGPVSLDMAVSSAGAISAPSGASPINIAQLLHALIPSSSG